MQPAQTHPAEGSPHKQHLFGKRRLTMDLKRLTIPSDMAIGREPARVVFPDPDKGPKDPGKGHLRTRHKKLFHHWDLYR